LGHKIEQGDRVVNMVRYKAKYTHTGIRRKMPIGTELTAYEVHYDVTPGQVPWALVGSKMWGREKVPLSMLQFLQKSEDTPSIVVKDVPKSKIKQQITMADGTKYTIIQPDSMRAKYGKGDPTKKESRLKGQFDKLEKFFGAAGVKAGEKLRSWVTEAYNQKGEMGVTLFIHKYVSETTGKPTAVVIQEHRWTGMRYRTGAPLQFEYKNAGKAMGLLKSRYGISIKMKDWRG